MKKRDWMLRFFKELAKELFFIIMLVALIPLLYSGIFVYENPIEAGVLLVVDICSLIFIIWYCVKKAAGKL